MEFQQKIPYILSSLFALVLVLAKSLSKSLNMALFPYVFALDNLEINNK